METRNKIAVITGASRGLGRDMALSLAKKETDIIFTYHSNKEAADEVTEEITNLGQKALALQLDTAKVASFDNFIAEVTTHLKEETGSSNFDFLINNAGTALYAPFMETTEEQFDEMVNIHHKGVFFLTQKALPFMNDGGRIITISSGLARFSLPGSSTYASMKGAVEVLTRYLAKELGGRKITANVVAPGAIETDFGNGRVRDDEKANEMVANITALGRAGLPEDIGGIVAFLCSPEARWINGQRIEASGGMML
ncbi:SDR family NAD(P)-dependent oxidoreductase [Leeuwenhoekiella marinoflava]|uniref:NAD(P)-dependent dehydrogenase (Short-subunit alcohol dehydrogenase family) n=2 Tax=Leeuwenhoekiella marinoflava TaxID=988 RepID=A0A4Q0PCQ9_9FLAO|nr:SDR family oxidoreductase [Leeuwenhoekiella marinoflava]RXG24156.1 NAD(P)-dependent dehydrogenase (short-subunit alcohol dehydrogenase family) [Leeuwenhoekiella marinoflava]SHF92766.1 NAD(P)-dependent dehydrogenase, short-chain alcohol dehydrogenase family [Leeuwenhoekiella marinoflava DSM 3653]